MTTKWEQSSHNCHRSNMTRIYFPNQLFVFKRNINIRCFYFSNKISVQGYWRQTFKAIQNRHGNFCTVQIRNTGTEVPMHRNVTIILYINNIVTPAYQHIPIAYSGVYWQGMAEDFHQSRHRRADHRKLCIRESEETYTRGRHFTRQHKNS